MQNPLLAPAIFIPIALILIAFGRTLLPVLRVKPDSSLERSLFGAALGFGVFAHLILGIGLCRLLYPSVLLGLLLLAGLISRREPARLLGECRVRSGNVAIVLPLLLLAWVALIRALAPPSEMDWDGLAYHLAVPKVYLAHHAVHYIPYDSHSNLPFLIEMLYALGLAFGSVGTAKLFHFAMYALSAGTIFSLSRRHLNTLIGAVGALIFASVPVVIWEAGNAYSDVATALYVTLAVYAVLNWEQTRANSWLTISGVMCGFALGTKVLALVPTAALCLWVLFAAKGLGRGARAALLIGGLALLIGSPWYVKSWVYTGNPVYPFLHSIFGGKYWSREAADAYRHAQLVFGMGHGPRELLMLPWNLTVHGTYFFDEPTPNAPKLFGLIGPAFLGLIPLRIIFGHGDRTTAKIGLVCAVYVVAWFFLMQQTRYLIGIVPLLAIIAASGLEVSRNVTRAVAVGFLGLCIGLGLFTGYAIARPCVKAAVGIEPPDQYLSRTLDCFDAQEYANQFLPENAKVVMFDEVRGFYLGRAYIWGNPGHSELIPWRTIRTGDQMVRYFTDHGFTHALLNERLAKYSGKDLLHQTLIPQAVSDGQMREVYSSNGVILYELAGK